MLKEHLKIKKVISMALIDLKKTYRGSILGWIWIVFKPSVTIFVYWFAFAIGMKSASEISGHPYFLWLIAGLLPWLYISELVTRSSNVYKKYNYLVTKIHFPVSTIPTFTSISRIIVNIVLSVLVILIYLFTMKQIDIYFIQLPIYTLLMYLFFTNFTAILALLSSISKDISKLVTTFTMPLLFLTPIFYDINNISIGWVKTVQLFNPVHFCVNGFRNIFIYKKWFFEEPLELIIFLTMTILFVFLFGKLYKKLKKDLPDYL